MVVGDLTTEKAELSRSLVEGDLTRGSGAAIFFWLGDLTTELAEKAEAWLGVGTREMPLLVGLGLEWIKGVGILVG